MFLDLSTTLKGFKFNNNTNWYWHKSIYLIGQLKKQVTQNEFHKAQSWGPSV